MTSALDGILLPLFGARIVEIARAPHRNGEIRLLDARQHLGVEGVLERLDVLRHRRRVGVLGFEIARHFGIRFLAQPEIIVDDGLAVPLLAVFVDGRDGRSAYMSCLPREYCRIATVMTRRPRLCRRSSLSPKKGSPAISKISRRMSLEKWRASRIR